MLKSYIDQNSNSRITFIVFGGELIYVLSIVVCIPSTFCHTLGYHQGKIYYKNDVTFISYIITLILLLSVYQNLLIIYLSIYLLVWSDLSIYLSIDLFL